jgi:hypothetical protein
MFNIPVFYADIMTLWLVAFPDSLIISSVSGIVNVMSLVPSAPSLHNLGCVEGIIIAVWAQ